MSITSTGTPAARARASFSSNVSWARMRASPCSRESPRACSRSSCCSGLQFVMTTRSKSPARSVSKSSGMSATPNGALRNWRYQSPIAWYTRGWMMASRSVRASGLRKTMAAMAARSSVPKRARTASAPGVPSAITWRAKASASMVGAPLLTNRAKQWLLPVAIPPVSATRRDRGRTAIRRDRVWPASQSRCRSPA